MYKNSKRCVWGCMVFSNHGNAVNINMCTCISSQKPLNGCTSIHPKRSVSASIWLLLSDLAAEIHLPIVATLALVHLVHPQRKAVLHSILSVEEGRRCSKPPSCSLLHLPMLIWSVLSSASLSSLSSSPRRNIYVKNGLSTVCSMMCLLSLQPQFQRAWDGHEHW